MNNATKPVGNECPKCRGFYEWLSELGRCLNCGYEWNPPIPVPEFKIPHCCFGQCVRPIEKIEQIFCERHQGELVRGQVLKNIAQQRRYTTRKANQDDGQIRLNAPIMVKLKVQFKKPVA